MLFYAPRRILPGTMDTVAGQLDIAPTVLGMLNISYTSDFFGRDLFENPQPARAFIGNYQSLGLIENDKLQLLLPQSKSRCYRIDPDFQQHLTLDDHDMILDAIAFYQGAFRLWQQHLRHNRQ
jgi:phosphoglycerol transferase MdoB-like AlkP superfamily enzyme